jgi:hypothetical protein
MALSTTAACTTVLGIDGDYHESATLSCPMDKPPEGGDCPEACSGGCEGASCLIDCNFFRSCHGEPLVCPEGFDCVVSCGGRESCEGASILCPAAHACQVSCSGNMGCQDATIACGGGSCSLACDGNSCSGATLTCGVGHCQASCADPDDAPAVDCSPSCLCETC